MPTKTVASLSHLGTASYLRGPGELSEGIRVGDEGKAAATTHHFLYVRVELEGEVTEDGENGKAGEQRGAGVREADDPYVPAGEQQTDWCGWWGC